MKKIYLLGMAIILGGIFISCSFEPAVDKSGEYEFKYEISGTAQPSTISYLDGENTSKNVSNPSLPWTYEFSRYIEDGKYNPVSLNVNAAKGMNDTGTLTAKIYYRKQGEQAWTLYKQDTSGDSMLVIAVGLFSI